MKFLIQIPRLIYAGAEKVLVNFANDLVSRGHDVTILEIYETGLLNPQFDPAVKFDSICSNEYSKKYYASLDEIKNEKTYYKKLLKCVKLFFSKIVGYRRFAEKMTAKRYKNKVFDVAINYLETESPRFLKRSIHAKKYLQWVHIDVANMNSTIEIDRMLPDFEKMDAIICVAESARKSFLDRYPVLTEKTHVIYNYYDADSIIEKGKEPYEFPNRKENVPVFLSVGRMTAQKQYLRFLDVLAHLHDDGFEFQWYVLGTGPEKQEIEKKIERLDLGDRVFLLGMTDNPYKYMANCDLFVLPSGWEGFPTVTVEAKILNCVVFATDVSGIREQMEHGKTGWIVENTEDGIYRGMKFLLDTKGITNKYRGNIDNLIILNSENKYRKLMEIVHE